MCVQHNRKARSRNHCCRGKAINITYFCVRAWVSARARVCGCRCTGAEVCLRACGLTNPGCNAPPYCHLWPLWLHVFRHYLINGCRKMRPTTGLETSSAKTEPFAAERPKSFQCYTDRDESLKSQNLESLYPTFFKDRWTICSLHIPKGESTDRPRLETRMSLTRADVLLIYGCESDLFDSKYGFPKVFNP